MSDGAPRKKIRISQISGLCLPVSNYSSELIELGSLVIKKTFFALTTIAFLSSSCSAQDNYWSHRLDQTECIRDLSWPIPKTSDAPLLSLLDQSEFWAPAQRDALKPTTSAIFMKFTDQATPSPTLKPTTSAIVLKTNQVTTQAPVEAIADNATPIQRTSVDKQIDSSEASGHRTVTNKAVVPSAIAETNQIQTKQAFAEPTQPRRWPFRVSHWATFVGKEFTKLTSYIPQDFSQESSVAETDQPQQELTPQATPIDLVKEQEQAYPSSTDTRSQQELVELLQVEPHSSLGVVSRQTLDDDSNGLPSPQPKLTLGSQPTLVTPAAKIATSEPAIEVIQDSIVLPEVATAPTIVTTPLTQAELGMPSHGEPNVALSQAIDGNPVAQAKVASDFGIATVKKPIAQVVAAQTSDTTSATQNAGVTGRVITTAPVIATAPIAKPIAKPQLTPIDTPDLQARATGTFNSIPVIQDVGVAKAAITTATAPASKTKLAASDNLGRGAATTHGGAKSALAAWWLYVPLAIVLLTGYLWVLFRKVATVEQKQTKVTEDTKQQSSAVTLNHRSDTTESIDKEIATPRLLQTGGTNPGSAHTSEENTTQLTDSVTFEPADVDETEISKDKKTVRSAKPNKASTNETATASPQGIASPRMTEHSWKAGEIVNSTAPSTVALPNQLDADSIEPSLGLTTAPTTTVPTFGEAKNKPNSLRHQHWIPTQSNQTKS